MNFHSMNIYFYEIFILNSIMKVKSYDMMFLLYFKYILNL